MTTYVALLRGVNVGGKSTVPMARLRDLLSSLGHTDVRTYIQSGNVVFDAAGRKKPDAGELAGAINTEFGVPTTVVLRTPAELAKVVAGNPFPSADDKALHVGFLASPPERADVAALDLGSLAPDEAHVGRTEIYLHLPNGMGRSKLPSYLDRRLKVPTTYRNWNTVKKLIDLTHPNG